jgi:putative transposase
MPTGGSPLGSAVTRVPLLSGEEPVRAARQAVWFANSSSATSRFRGSAQEWLGWHLFDDKMRHFTMFALLLSMLSTLRSALRTRADLALENLALRQQLANLRCTSARPRLRGIDRAFWLVLSRLWSRWADVLVVVKPDTVVRWHRTGFRLFWRWKSRSRSPAESDTSADVKALIRQMAEANVGWGAPRIHGELLKLGFVISERSVSRFMPKRPAKPPSQTWRTFLDNHLGALASIDFFTVPTATFRVLFVFLVLVHERRRVVHFNVTEHPSALWTAQQIIEAFPEDTAPKYMIRDRDGIYGEQFRRRVEAMGIEEVLTTPRSPWQNPYAERLVGSVRQECLDHVIVLGERHLLRILKSYFVYYIESRTHLSLGKDAPEPRTVHPPHMGDIVELPEVGGLHHRYERRAA